MPMHRHRQWYDFWPNGMTYFGSNGIDRLFFKGQLLVDDHGWRENLASRKERPMVKMKE